MPRFLATLILSLSLLIPSALASANKKPALTLTQPITRLYSNQQPICTTWAIDTQMWITAAHCVLPEQYYGDDYEDFMQPEVSPVVFGIANTPADLIAADPRLDLAMLYTPEAVAIKPLTLKSSEPAIDSHARIVGFPRMWSDLFDRPLSLDVTVKAEFVETHCSAQYQMVMQGSAAGGNSGSPVIQNGRVISVLQCAFGESIVTGATWSDLVRFVASHVHDTIPA